MRAAADCSITAVSVNFGVYDPVAPAPDDSTGTVTVTCRIVGKSAERVNYTVTLSNGMNASTPSARQMASGTRRLGYNVYTDPARAQVWGSGSGGTVIASGAMTVGPGVGNGNGTLSVTHTLTDVSRSCRTPAGKLLGHPAADADLLKFQRTMAATCSGSS